MQQMHERRLYAALAILQLVPVWSVRYLPTTDGPSHLYNSWLIRELLTHPAAEVATWFQIQLLPQPNWIGHALMAALLTIFPPLVTEKIFVSLILVLSAIGAWMFAGVVNRRSSVFAFLAFPLATNWLFHAGFYNFCISVPLFFITLALWWRWRDAPAARHVAIIALLLIVDYFSHPMSTGLLVVSIGILWLRHRDVRHLIAFIPVFPLLVWYASLQGEPGRGSSRFVRLLLALVNGQIVVSFSTWQRIFGIVIAAALIVLIVASARRSRSDRDAHLFALLAALFTILYFVIPDAASGGLFVHERLTLFIYLLPLAWLQPFRSDRVRRFFVAAFALVAVANTTWLTVEYVHASKSIREFVAGTASIAEGATVLPIVFEPRPPFLVHAIDYAATERHFVDLDNYEPLVGYFPIVPHRRVTEEVNLIPLDPGALTVTTWAPFTDYIYAWAMPPFLRLQTDIEHSYRLVETSGEGRLYQRMLPRDRRSHDDVLLPIAGTVKPLSGSMGVQFRVDQSVRNAGTKPVHVIASACALTSSCEFDLTPGASAPLAAEPERDPFIVVSTDKGAAKQLSFSTTVRATGWPDVAIPAVVESDVATGRVVLANVPTNAALNLRVWLFDAAPATYFTVRMKSKQKRYLAGPNGFAIESLDNDFADMKSSAANVDVEIEAPRTRVWAMITATDYAHSSMTVWTPRR